MNPPPRFWKQRILWLLAAALAVCVYLLAARLTFRIGFPLDDAWIHQTYARNLALRGEWSFVPGQPSAGSTAPLWSLLLAGGYLFGIMPHLGSYVLGGACLALLAWAGQRAFDRLAPGVPARLPWLGLFLIGEWHLTWAAVSGMETPLMAALIVLVCAALLAARPNWLLIGAMTGLAVWVRPDGLTLLGPALFSLFFVETGWRERRNGALKLLTAFALFFAPYLLFNRALEGSFWPNTFYAKQSEYAIMVQSGLLERMGSLFLLPLVGAGALLLPGLIFGLYRALRTRNAQSMVTLALFLWWAGYTTLYALRLPVTYQHGRYLMPSMPVYFLLGLAGTVAAVRALRRRSLRWGWVIGQAWLLALLLVWLAFFGLGAQAYGQDVAIIETEMVDSAHWIAANTEPGALIAAHDIGALGYFGERDILDLAGLISPEVIPFIRDEARLAETLNARQVNYLMTFPGWYPLLIQSGAPVYVSQGRFAPELGGENMQVYRWLGH